MRAALTSGLLTVALLAACTDPAEPPAADPSDPPATSATPTVTESESETPESEPPPPSPEPITLAFAGDVHFEGPLRERLADPATALAPYTATLAAADLAMVNLETSVGSGGAPDPDKRFTFQAPPSAFRALAAAGIDVATMANNHALDFGTDPLPGTFAAIDSAARANPPLAVVGLGRDVDDAFRPALTDVDGTVVATIGSTIADTDPTADPTGQWAATEDSPGTADAVDPTRLLRAVADADAGSDVVVVYLHWGIQGEQCPSDGQQSLATDLVEAGADVVVGSHAHELQGDGRLGDGYVAYGLGNYAWYQPSETGVLTLTVQPPAAPDGRAEVTGAVWEWARVGPDGLPAPVSGAAAAELEADRTSLRTCAGLG